MIILNAENAIMGRLATIAAKYLVTGEQVAVINIEKAVISGNPEKIVEVYRKRRGIQNKANPEESTKWPRKPDLLFKRVMQGMLPKNTRGEKLLKQIKAYIGVPKEFADKVSKAEAPKKLATTLMSKSITLNQLCKDLGWHA